jgi:cytochrome c553
MRVDVRTAAAVLLLSLASGPARAQAAPPPAAMLAQCAACHGDRGVSLLPGTPSLAAQPKVFTETQLVLIREGLREVPVMKAVLAGMSDETITALAAHYAAQPAPPAAPVKPGDQAAAGAALAQRMLCGTCHLARYEGQQQVPRLAGQREDYLLATMKQLRDNPGPGRDTIMASTLRGASDADLAALAHHLATSKP